MVWVCEFQPKGESTWAFVFGTRKEALTEGKTLEKHGYKRKQVIEPTGTPDERTKQYEDSPEKHILFDDEYQILKQDYYYFGA